MPTTPIRRSRPLRALLGLATAALLLLAVEGLARAGMGSPPDPPGLWQRWDSQRPSFEQVEGTVVARYQDRSEPVSFAAQAIPGLPRVVFLGGSSMHGGSRIATDLELPAAAARTLAERGVAIEALNLGNPGLDSHDIRQLALEALSFGPELLVIYTGHNDLGNTLQEQRYGSFGGAVQVRLRLLLWRSRAYLLLRDLVSPRAGESGDGRRRPQPGEPDLPISDGQRLLAAEALQRNLVAITQQAAKRGVQTVLVTPISNWLMCRPIGRGCPEARAIIDLETYGSRPVPHDQLPALERALQAHPDCAELLHARGRLRSNDGDPRAADDLRRALATDPSPMRADATMTDAVRAAAREGGATLLDLEALTLESYSVPPQAWFVDCLHFSPEGHGTVGAMIADTVQAGLALP